MFSVVSQSDLWILEEVFTQLQQGTLMYLQRWIIIESKEYLEYLLQLKKRKLSGVTRAVLQRAM